VPIPSQETHGTDPSDQQVRILRVRHAALASQVGRAIPFAASSTPRRLVQIYNGGSMPSSPDHFFLAFPIELDGAETEGGTAASTDDASAPIVVDVLGHAPAAGDILTAYAVGGRWVAERGQSSSSGILTCSPCSIPEQNLTLSWVNLISGNGSTPLNYSNSPTPISWTSGCSNGLIYKLLCTGGEVEFRVIYFTAGTCPSGTQQYCSNLRVTPYGLTLSSYTCSPFSMTFLSKSAACPAITGSGYTQFTITL
jgi:hypothetical protein